MARWPRCSPPWRCSLERGRPSRRGTSQQLMDALAQNKSGRATFVETKHIAMLDRPVVSSGELLYTAPDRLEKRTLKPKPESMIVQGSELVIERGGRNYRVQLDAQPQLAAFIDSIRGTLAGDRKALERNYRLSLEGTPQDWVLRLVPGRCKMRGGDQADPDCRCARPGEERRDQRRPMATAP